MRNCDKEYHRGYKDGWDQATREMQRTIAALPKTADGVVIMPGMVCWYVSAGGRVVPTPEIENWSDIATDWDSEIPYYSTRAAAAASVRSD